MLKKPHRCLGGLINIRRSAYNEMDSTFGTWNVRKLFSIISLLSHLKQYRLDIRALHATRWQGKDIMDMTSHTLF
jgi:hypothetical protein